MFFNKILQLSKMFGYKRILHTVENKAEKLVWWQNMVLPLSSALMMRDCDEFVMVWTEYLSEKWLWNWLLFLHDSKYKLLNFQVENCTFLNTNAINSTRGLIGVCDFPWLTSPAETDALGQILHSGKTCMSFCLKGIIKDCS